MTRITSTRFGISYPDPAVRDERPDVAADIKRVVDALEASGVYFREDTLANRPAAGKHGFFFVSTDENPRVVYYDYGTGWQAVGTLPDNSVSTAKIQDGAVTWQKLADGSVIAGKIAADAVTQNELADNSVGTAEIQGGAVTLAKIAAAVQVYFTDQRIPLDNSVSTAKLQDGSVTNPKITGPIDAAKISGLTTALSYQKITLANDISMASAGTVYDAVQLTLPAGTWDIDGFIAVFSGTATSVIARLWDGTTVYRTGSTEVGINTSEDTIPVSDILVLGGTTTIRLAASTDHSGVASIKAKDNSGIGTITYMNAVKIA